MDPMHDHEAEPSLPIDALGGLAALAEPNRARIFEILRHGEHCVCDVGEMLGLSTALVSHHLRALRASGLIRERRAGRWVYYSLDLERVEALRTAVTTLLSPGEAATTDVPLLRLRRARDAPDAPVAPPRHDPARGGAGMTCSVLIVGLPVGRHVPAREDVACGGELRRPASPRAVRGRTSPWSTWTCSARRWPDTPTSRRASRPTASCRRSSWSMAPSCPSGGKLNVSAIERAVAAALEGWPPMAEPSARPADGRRPAGTARRRLLRRGLRADLRDPAPGAAVQPHPRCGLRPARSDHARHRPPGAGRRRMDHR